jgi:hypothetical protein
MGLWWCRKSIPLLEKITHLASQVEKWMDRLRMN